MNQQHANQIKSLCEDGILQKKYIEKESRFNQEITPSFSRDYAEKKYQDHVVIYEISHTLNGSYVGTTIEKANEKFLYTYFQELTTTIYFDYATAVTCYNPHLRPENDDLLTDLLSQLETLSNYPVLDENILSEIEVELETEYIHENIIPDLKSHIKNNYGIPEEIISDPFLFTIVKNEMEVKNEYTLFETGGNPFIDTDKLDLIEAIDKEITRLTATNNLKETIVLSLVNGLQYSTSPKDKRELFFSILKELKNVDSSFQQYENLSDYLI